MGSKPQSQSPTGSKKKPRKPRCSPQVISPATWEAVKSACIAGMGFSEAARTFGINNAHAVIMKSRTQHWPIPSRVQERARQLQRQLQRQSEAAQEARNGNDQAVEAAAQSWAEKGEMHRQLAFQIATSELKKVAHAPPPVESWRDVDFLDRIGRTSAPVSMIVSATRTLISGCKWLNFVWQTSLCRLTSPTHPALSTARMLQSPDCNTSCAKWASISQARRSIALPER